MSPCSRKGCGSLSHPVALDEFEAHDVLQLAKADGTRLQGPQQGFVEAQRPLHDALQPAAGPQPHQVADLVAGHLSGKQKPQHCGVIPASTAPPLPSLLPDALTDSLLSPGFSKGKGECGSLLPRCPNIHVGMVEQEVCWGF